MHSHMLWRTAATIASTITLCLTTSCGGGGGGAPQGTGRSTTPEATAQQPMPSETQTTTSTQVPGGAYGSTGTPTPSTGPQYPQGQASGQGQTTITSGQMGQGGAAQGGAAATPGELSNLSDEQIVAITIAANTGEVEQAKLAKDRAQNAKVKKFAERQITDHGQANRDEQHIVSKNKMTPAENATSQRLSSGSKQLVETLKSEKGAEFDRDYIDNEVRLHREVLDMIDNHLIQQAKTPELKSELQALRQKIQSHLSEAEDIQRALQMKP